MVKKNISHDTGHVSDLVDISKLSKEDHIFLWNDRTNSYDVINKNTGEMIHNGFYMKDLISQYQYNHTVGMMVCEQIRAGRTLADIGKDPSLPSASCILHWRSRNPEFRKMFEDAFRDRGHYFFDKVVSEVESIGDSLSRDENNAKKLKIDTYKWAASKADPDRYGERKPELHVSSPSSIVINTGVDLSNAPSIDDLLKPAVEAEFVEIQSGNREENGNDFASRETDTGSSGELA